MKSHKSVEAEGIISENLDNLRSIDQEPNIFATYAKSKTV
jgi:hypothetical protein